MPRKVHAILDDDDDDDDGGLYSINFQWIIWVMGKAMSRCVLLF